MKQDGLSTIEMIMSLLILAVLGSTAGYGLIGGVKAFSSNSDELQTLGKLRYASERMVREVREIRRDATNPANFDISSMNEKTLTFTKGDGTEVTLNAAPPLLTLAYAGPAGPQTLTDELGYMDIAYYQIDGSSPATNVANLAYIEFNLQLNRDGKSYPQRARAALRNRQ